MGFVLDLLYDRGRLFGRDKTTMSDWLTFEDDQYTSADLQGQIEKNYAERQSAKSGIPSSLEAIPHYGVFSTLPEPPENQPYSTSLFHHLRQANLLVTEIETEPNLADSAATRVPILGPLWKRVRQEAHHLVLFYVNRLAAGQNQVNAQLIGSMNELTRQNLDLQRQVAELQSRLQRLEPKAKEEGE